MDPPLMIPAASQVQQMIVAVVELLQQCIMCPCEKIFNFAVV